MKRHIRLARHYLRATGLCAVYVATVRGRVRVGVTRDKEGTGQKLRRERGKGQVLYWAADAGSATRIMREACRRWPGIDRGTKADAAEVVKAIPAIATAARIVLSDHASVQMRAERAAADIESKVKAMQAAGDLRGLNADYKLRRKEAAKAGRPIVSYGDFIERYKIRMLYELARLMKAAPRR